jgi:hypothetical protein
VVEGEVPKARDTSGSAKLNIIVFMMTNTTEIPKRNVTIPSRMTVCSDLLPNSDVDGFDISFPHFLYLIVRL